MSKLDQLMKKLESLESKKRDLSTELECVADEIENVKTMLEIINEALAERKKAQEEALATLICQRREGDKITDSDFLEFSRAADLGLSGLIEVPEPQDKEEALTQVA